LNINPGFKTCLSNSTCTAYGVGGADGEFASGGGGGGGGDDGWDAGGKKGKKKGGRK
jgi:hypothetical protein